MMPVQDDALFWRYQIHSGRWGSGPVVGSYLEGRVSLGGEGLTISIRKNSLVPAHEFADPQPHHIWKIYRVCEVGGDPDPFGDGGSAYHYREFVFADGCGESEAVCKAMVRRALEDMRDRIGRALSEWSETPTPT